MEDLCRLMKCAVQAMGSRFKQYLGQFATACVNTFMAAPLSCILYAVTSLISNFGREAEFVQPLLQMLEGKSQSSELRCVSNFQFRGCSF